MSGVYHKTEQMTWYFRSGSLEELGRQVDECVHHMPDGWQFSNVSVDSTVTPFRPTLGSPFGRYILEYEARVWAERADDE